MGMFDLPTGEVELKARKKGAKGKHYKWESVVFTNTLSRADIARIVEEWSNYRDIQKVRFNGKEVEIPKLYHWEVWVENDIVGIFKKNAEAVSSYKKAKTAHKRIKFVEGW